nr:hypothetical protein [Desulfobacula sp.]
MKKIKLMGVIGLLVLLCPALACFAKPPVRVDILYMNHGPMQPTLRELKALIPEYKDALAVSWYDFESRAGEEFKRKMGITQHIPLVIWVNGRFDHTVKGRDIRFQGFPSGSGPTFSRADGP